MNPIVAIVAAALLLGTASADTLLDADATLTVEGVDPAVDGTHTVELDVATAEDGTPVVSLIVDGEPVLA